MQYAAMGQEMTQESKMCERRRLRLQPAKNCGCYVAWQLFASCPSTLPQDLDIPARMPSCQMVSYRYGKMLGKLIVGTSAEVPSFGAVLVAGALDRMHLFI